MSRARCPAKFAYHVWLWTRSASSRPVAIARLTDIVWSALEYGSPRATVSHGVKARTSGPSDVASRGAPKHRTSISMSRASSTARYSTCTPAPPYTSGGYSRVSRATLMSGSVAVLGAPPAPQLEPSDGARCMACDAEPNENPAAFRTHAAGGVWAGGIPAGGTRAPRAERSPVGRHGQWNRRRERSGCHGANGDHERGRRPGLHRDLLDELQTGDHHSHSLGSWGGRPPDEDDDPWHLRGQCRRAGGQSRSDRTSIRGGDALAAGRAAPHDGRGGHPGCGGRAEVQVAGELRTRSLFHERQEPVHDRVHPAGRS